jgi:hypothetical protein
MSAADEELLSIWVVYDHPLDWPDYYVARRHVALPASIAGPTDEMILDKNLDRIRRDMQQRGLVKLDRFPEDDPKIMETWI